MQTRQLRWAVWPLVLGLLAVGALTQSARAEVRLPKVFSSHMVLQQGKPVIVWGWAQPEEQVTVEIGSARQQVKANATGEWKATLPAMKAGGPSTVTVSSSNRI